MNWKAHGIIGILTSLLFIVGMNLKFGWYDFKNPIVLAQLIVIVGISGLVPDLDHENGKLHQWLIGIGLMIALVGVGYLLLVHYGLTVLGEGYKVIIAVGVILTASTFFAGQIANHRGFWHSIPLCIIYGAVIFILTGARLEMGCVATIGCYSHLVADGVPLKMR